MKILRLLKSDISQQLTLSVPEKLKNSVFEMPIIPQTLNINNLRTTSAKSINLQKIRKLIENYLKNVRVKTVFTLTLLEILLFGWRVGIITLPKGIDPKVDYANFRPISLLSYF